MTASYSATLAPPARPDLEDLADSPAFVRPATPADVPMLAAVLARAFYDDPPLMWLLPDPARRLDRVTRMFATVIGIESLRYGGVDVVCAGGKILGGAVWLPPATAGRASTSRSGPCRDMSGSWLRPWAGPPGTGGPWRAPTRRNRTGT